MGGVRAYAIFFLPSHKALMKRLLMEVHGEEGDFTSNGSVRKGNYGPWMQGLGFGCPVAWHEVFTLKGGLEICSFIRKVVVLGEIDWKTKLDQIQQQVQVHVRPLLMM